MNITKTMKEAAIWSAMKDIFEAPAEELCKATQEKAVEIWEALYGSDAARISGMILDHNWLDNTVGFLHCKVIPKKGDGSLSVINPDYCYGPYRHNGHSLYVWDVFQRDAWALKTPRPMPSRSPNELLLIGKNKTFAMEQYQAMNAMCREERRLTEELRGFLAGIRTLKVVKATWPDGVKYFPTEAPKKLPLAPPTETIKALKNIAA